jgi:hypothetical protein
MQYGEAKPGVPDGYGPQVLTRNEKNSSTIRIEAGFINFVG